MKYSRLIALLLVIAIAFSLVGCKNDEDDYVHKDGEGGEEEGGEGDLGNGVTYVYTSTKLHRSNCYYAAGMDELFKKSYSGDLSELVDKGFSFCGLCCYEEREIYGTATDNENGINPEDATYVLNTNPRNLKFHFPDCYHVESMSPSNTEYTDLQRETIIEHGYIPCKHCKP